MKLSSGGHALRVQASPARFQESICVKVPADVVVRSRVRLHGIFSENSFNVFVHFMIGDLGAHLPILWADLYAPPSLFTQSRPEQLFFLFPRAKKVHKKEILCLLAKCGSGETKNSRSTRRHQNQFKTVLSSGKNVSIGVLYQMESTL